MRNGGSYKTTIVAGVSSACICVRDAAARAVSHEAGARWLRARVVDRETGEMLRSGCDNATLVDDLADSYERVHPRTDSDSSRRATKRSKDRAQDVSRLFLQLPRTPESILDVGCGNGSIFRAVGSRFPTAALLATDLRRAGERGGLRVPAVDAGDDPVRGRLRGRCAAIHVGAPLRKLDTTLAELKRVLAPGGYVVLRDHDFRSETDHVFMDLVHMFYACIAGDEEEPKEFLQSFWSNYHSQSEWIRIFEKNGFTLERTVKFNKRDIFRSFYAVFRTRTD